METIAASSGTEHAATSRATPKSTPHRILILGGGFAGIYTAQHLDRRFRKNPTVEITLVSRENYFLMTPLLFEAGSGVLEPRHSVIPIRTMLNKARYVQADVDRVDFDARKVFAHHPGGMSHHEYELPYDQIVLALGGVTNRSLIPGSQHALAFKTLSDAIFIRNRIIDLFEQADIEQDQDRRRTLLTFVFIGGGLVGIELLGELTEFIDNLLRNYPRIARSEIRYFLIEANPRILLEMHEDLAHYASTVLQKRGVQIITDARVASIEHCKVHLPPSTNPTYPLFIDAQTILLTAGVAANPLLADFSLKKSRHGRIPVEASMRSAERPEVWAIGDCAVIPDPTGKPYPPLAQHALREAKVLARNIATVVQHPNNTPALEPFDYKTLGMLASLGHYSGTGTILGIKIYGFFAWWVWRTYYLLQMPHLDRRIRVILDWTVALFFRNDAVKLDLFGEEHPSRRDGQPRSGAA